MTDIEERSDGGIARAKPPLGIILLIALPLMISAVWWFAGGVMLVATNGSGSEVGNLKVAYGQGVAHFGELPAGATQTRLLGRIGEGATLHVELERGGEHLEYHADVYFVDLGFFRT